MEFIDDNYCFACGKNNEIGLKLSFDVDKNTHSATTQTILKQHYNGWKKAAHGGIIATILDEVMVYACHTTGFVVVTGEIKVRFKKPVPLNQRIDIFGKVDEIREKMMITSGTIKMGDNILAEGHAKMIIVKKK